MNDSTTAFKENQIENIYPEGSENHYWSLARNYTIKRWLKSECKNLGVCFDVGCGKGFTISYLRKNGYQAYGSDIADYRPVKSAEAFIFSKATLSQLPIEVTSKVECILLLDVIEHLPKPEELIFEITKTFPNASRLLITVPARQEIWSNYDEFNCHYMRYSRENLSALANRLNYKIVKSSYFFHTLYIPALVLKVFGFKRSTNFPGPRSLISIIINKILSLYFILEQMIIPKSFYGSSLIGVLSIYKNEK